MTAETVRQPEFEADSKYSTIKWRSNYSKSLRHKLPIVFLFLVIHSLTFLYENHLINFNTYKQKQSDSNLRNYDHKSNSRVQFIKGVSAFDELERIKLRDEARDMFYHAYFSYMKTYPADEILPISCRGRFRQAESDIDQSISNVSLTLVDSLSTLVVIGDVDNFGKAIKKIINDLNFDKDIVVSVFETNIRMLGGLLSAHILAKSIQNKADRRIRYINETSRSGLDWYNSELLDLAEDLARRLLPAFDTKTGIPHPRVNLRYGLETDGLKDIQETCTACAGTLILEFATLSRLTGDDVFESVARRALDSIWEHRHRSTDLVGGTIDVNTGQWSNRFSGVGAGSDSYYEYLMKAYSAGLGQTYLHRFNRHYASVMRYMSRGPFLLDVHMHRPNRIAKGFMDALSAFWPGLQVLKGDLRSAISTHAMFNEVIRRHGYLPEAFTTDLEVFWGHHNLRPEFIESCYLLYRATNNNYYLEIGKNILEKLQDLKVECGYASIRDVRHGFERDENPSEEKSMPSYVLAETLKYLYLLFSHDNETHVDLEKFVFSSEGHMLPIGLGIDKPSIDVEEENDEEQELHEFEKLSAAELNGKALNKEARKHLTQSADLTRLLIKMNEKFSQDRSVISLNQFDDSCPSLELQEMRFDRDYHPFLQRRIGTNHYQSFPSEDEYSADAQVSHLDLLERVREFTSSDPDYLRLASSLGLVVTVQGNRLSLKLGSSDQQSNSLDGRCMI